MSLSRRPRRSTIPTGCLRPGATMTRQGAARLRPDLLRRVPDRPDGTKVEAVWMW